MQDASFMYRIWIIVLILDYVLRNSNLKFLKKTPTKVLKSFTMLPYESRLMKLSMLNPSAIAKTNFDKSKFELFTKLTLFEKTLLMKLLVAQVSKVTEPALIRHSRKLQLLWHKQRPSSPDCLLNLS